MKRLLLLATLCICSIGQSTKVIPLEPADAKLAKETFDAMVAADKRWEQVNGYLTKRYLGDKPQDTAVFSDDFRYLLKGVVNDEGAEAGTVQWNGAGLVYSNSPKLTVIH